MLRKTKRYGRTCEWVEKRLYYLHDNAQYAEGIILQGGLVKRCGIGLICSYRYWMSS